MGQAVFLHTTNRVFPFTNVEIGGTVEGIVIRLFKYGSLVRLPGARLVHISEIADAYVRDIHDHFKEDDRIPVKVRSLDEKGRYVPSAKRGLKSLDAGPALV